MKNNLFVGTIEKGVFKRLGITFIGLIIFSIVTILFAKTTGSFVWGG